MYAFTVRMKVHPDKAASVRDALLAVAEPSRAEPGCLLYLPHVIDEERGEFLIYERYRDRDAHAAHRQTEHYERWVAGEVVPHLQERKRIECVPLEP